MEPSTLVNIGTVGELRCCSHRVAPAKYRIASDLVTTQDVNAVNAMVTNGWDSGFLSKSPAYCDGVMDLIIGTWYSYSHS